MTADNNSLGPWSGGDFARTARLNSGLGSDTDVPDDVRFLRGVFKVLRKRIAQQIADPDRPAIFLLAPTPTSSTSNRLSTRVPMLDNGQTPVNGRLWFVSTVVVTGHYVELDDDNDDKLFRTVTDDLRMGSVPAVLYDPRGHYPEIRFYPNGFDDPEEYQGFPATKSNISLDVIFDKITQIYNRHMTTLEALLESVDVSEDTTVIQRAMYKRTNGNEHSLISFLEELTFADFSRVIIRLPGAANQIPNSVSPHEKVAALIGYVQSSTGGGMESLVKVVEELFPDVVSLQSNIGTRNNSSRDNQKWIVIPNAEAELHRYLRVGLSMAFPTCRISESPDLEIEENDASEEGYVIRHAILVLKVLQSYDVTGNPVSEEDILGCIDQGIRRAAMRRVERSAVTSALCCFDMRLTDEGNSCFDQVKELSDNLEVKLGRWYIYSTSEQYNYAITSRL